MEQESIHIGIDVAKEQVDIAVRSSDRTWSVSCEDDDVGTLLGKLQKLSPAAVILEATGGMEMPLVGALAAAFLPVAVVNPRQVRDFAKSTGQLAETDRLDARVLAHFGEAVKPFQAHISRLEQELDDQDNDLHRTARDSQVWRERDQLLLSVPGIVEQVSITLLADLPEPGTLSRKQIAALVGVAPLNRASGPHRSKLTVWGGRARVRAALYMGALVASRWNPVIRDSYQRLLAAGEPKKVALTACLRILLTIPNGMLSRL